jgi:hypothetical protein
MVQVVDSNLLTQNRTKLTISIFLTPTMVRPLFASSILVPLIVVVALVLVAAIVSVFCPIRVHFCVTHA